MTESQKDTPIDLGIYDRARSSGFSAAELIALILSVIWIGAMSLFFVFADTSETGGQFDSFILVMTILAIFMPVAVIWIGAVAARSTRIMREESARLQAAIDAMRHTYVVQARNLGSGAQPTVERKLDEIAKAQKQTESAIVTFASSRESAPRPAPPAAPEADTEGQTALALGTTAEDLSPPLSNADFIRALNFPETQDDSEGFNALRRALKNRQTAKLVQAAQDVLTLLSQDGIYMDDLRPDRARPEIWRKFAAGERGRAVASLGGVRDRSSLALSAGRMRQDSIFRDTMHHFLRQFDKTFVAFESTATDPEIAALSDTRTARAFMLLGRVAGTFD